jgi:hypothetical protein
MREEMFSKTLMFGNASKPPKSLAKWSHEREETKNREGRPREGRND